MATEALTSREQIAAGVVAFLLLVLFLRAVRRRRALTRRLSSVTARLVGPGALAVDGRGGLERTLSTLEQAAQEGTLRVSDAGAAEQRLVLALDHTGEGVVVWDAAGEE